MKKILFIFIILFLLSGCDDYEDERKVRTCEQCHNYEACVEYTHSSGNIYCVMKGTNTTYEEKELSGRKACINQGGIPLYGGWGQRMECKFQGE